MPSTPKGSFYIGYMNFLSRHLGSFALVSDGCIKKEKGNAAIVNTCFPVKQLVQFAAEFTQVKLLIEEDAYIELILFFCRQ